MSIIDKVIFQKRDTEFALIINKESSLTEIDSRADINGIQEGLIPVKYYEKSSERLTHANGEKLIKHLMFTYVMTEYVLKLFLF